MKNEKLSQKKKEKNDLSTRTSERVPHIRTIRARSGLTSLCGWEAVLSTGYGRDNDAYTHLVYLPHINRPYDDIDQLRSCGPDDRTFGHLRASDFDIDEM